MATPKNPGRAVSIRIAPGSALERLTAGQPFTATVHRMAELFEKALDENWGPPPKPVIPVEVDRATRLAPGIEQALEALRANAQAVREMTGLTDEQRGLPEPERVFQLVEPDGKTTRTVSQSEVLKLAAEQAPSGLVPVGLDEGDDEPADLSHLV